MEAAEASPEAAEAAFPEAAEAIASSQKRPISERIVATFNILYKPADIGPHLVAFFRSNFSLFSELKGLTS